MIGCRYSVHLVLWLNIVTIMWYDNKSAISCFVWMSDLSSYHSVYWLCHCFCSFGTYCLGLLRYCTIKYDSNVWEECDLDVCAIFLSEVHLGRVCLFVCVILFHDMLLCTWVMWCYLGTRCPDNMQLVPMPVQC